MIKFETEVLELIQRTHNVKSFRFKTKKDVNFKAGQYFSVTIKIGGKEQTKHFSFSNSPTEKGFIEFTKKITDSDFSKALDKLQAGDWAHLNLPAGNFTFEGEYEKIAFLSGGIGITPIRSMCKFATDKKLSTDIILLYGNNTEKDIVFRDDFDQMHKNNHNLRVIHTLTSPNIDKNSWQGRIGLIDVAMIKKEISDFAERTFFVCGPPKMVKSLSSILTEELSLAKDKVKTENFPGY